jgi:hypothetical protein
LVRRMQGVYRAPDIDADGRAGYARLADLGQREAALTACEEAAAIRRELAAAWPDTFLPDLAQSLNQPIRLPQPRPGRGRLDHLRGGGRDPARARDGAA